MGICDAGMLALRLWRLLHVRPVARRWCSLLRVATLALELRWLLAVVAPAARTLMVPAPIDVVRLASVVAIVWVELDVDRGGVHVHDAVVSVWAARSLNRVGV